MQSSRAPLPILNGGSVELFSMDGLETPFEKQLTSADGIEDSRLRRFYEYWAAKKGDRRFPTRADIDPLEFGYVLGHILLPDVVHEPLRFRYRVHGTQIVMRVGYDLTGKFLDDVPVTDYRRYVRERCARLVHDGEPLLVHHNRTLDGRTRHYEAIWLPISEDGQNVSMLMCALIYDWERQ